MFKSKQIINLGLSLIVTIMWLLLAVKTLPMVFMTNDDASIQMTLAGMCTGTPYPYHQFINSLLGMIIAGLYHISSSIPWWYAWSILCVLVGIACVQWTIFENVSNKLEAVLMIGIIGFSFWIYVLGNIAFTVVPCIFSLGVIFLLFSNDSPKWNYPFIILCSIVVIISCWHRGSTGWVMFCYFAMALLYFVFCCRNLDFKQKILRYVGTVGIVFIVIIVSSQIDSVIKEQRNSDEFRAYNSARVAYMDYSHVSYKENPEVYESYGWDENLTSLVSSWCFLDERVTAEAFLGISNAEPLEGITEVHTGDESDSFFAPLTELLESNKYALILSYFTLLVFLFGEFYICICGFFKSKIHFFFVSNAGGSMILLFYLIWRERLPLRAYMIILIPMISISCLLLMKVHRESNEKHNVLWYIYLGVLLGLTVPAFLYNYDAESINKKVERIENCNAIDSYLREHSQNIYISDFGAYDSNYPFGQVSSNLIHWGGSTFHSEYFYLQLQANGLSELNMETFKQDNVYMITTSSGTEEYSKTIQKLFDCLVDYGAVGVQKVDTINGTRDVYKFYFEE